MSPWVIVAGVLGGLGIFLVVRELIPAPARLDAALARLESAPVPGRGASVSLRLARHISAELPWLPAPTADLALLGQDRDTWIASKITCGLLGLAVPPALVELLALGGFGIDWQVPAIASLACGAVLFFAPDLVTKVNAAERRTDFRHALTATSTWSRSSGEPAPGPPRHSRPPPTSAAAGRSAASRPPWTPPAGPATRRGRPWPGWPARPASASSPTWPTSLRSPGTKAPRSWTPSRRGRPPCGARPRPRNGPGPAPAAPRW